MRNNHLPVAVNRGYSFCAAAKSAAGIKTPNTLTATPDAHASFLLSQPAHTCSMVGCVGAEQSAPVPVNAGSLNPAQSITQEIKTSSDGFISLLTEAALMATTPTLLHPAVCRALLPVAEVCHA